MRSSPVRRSPVRSGLLLLLALPLPAEAAGYFLVGAGTRPMGRAGAAVAGVDDLSAQTYNPAALSRVQGSLVSLQLAGAHQRVFFDRADESGEVFAPVTNSAPPLPIPGLAGARRFGQVTVALGIYTPVAPTLAFPADGAQRFTLVDSVIISGNVGPTVAWQATERLSVGAGVAWTLLTLDQTIITHVSPSGFAPTDQPEYDVSTLIQAQDLSQFTWNAGLLYDAGTWAGAASFSPAVPFTATGSMAADFTSNAYYTGDSSLGQLIAQPTVTDEDVRLPLTLPAIARIGLLVRPTAGLEVEISGFYEGWSSLETVTLFDVNMDIEMPTEDGAEPQYLTLEDDAELPIRMQDAFSVRLGAQQVLSERWIGRAGLYWESSAAAEETRSVLVPDAGKVGYGLGASAALGSAFSLDLGLTQGFAPRHEITGSQVYQLVIEPLEGEILRGKTVGNGEFGLVNTVIGIGLSWAG